MHGFQCFERRQQNLHPCFASGDSHSGPYMFLALRGTAAQSIHVVNQNLFGIQRRTTLTVSLSTRISSAGPAPATVVFVTFRSVEVDHR